MAKVAEYEGNVSVKEVDGTLVISMEFMQGEIRTTYSTVLSPGEMFQAFRGQKVSATLFEDAVQTRRAKPKQETLEG